MTSDSVPSTPLSTLMDSLSDSWSADVWELYATASAEYRVEVQARQVMGHQVREARVRLGLTQVEVAQISGVNQPELSRIERGFANPTLVTLAKLADALQGELRIVAMERQTLSP